VNASLYFYCCCCCCLVESLQKLSSMERVATRQDESMAVSSHGRRTKKKEGRQKRNGSNACRTTGLVRTSFASPQNRNEPTASDGSKQKTQMQPTFRPIPSKRDKTHPKTNSCQINLYPLAVTSPHIQDYPRRAGPTVRKEPLRILNLARPSVCYHETNIRPRI
jgi:hypothetical protein